MAVISFPSPGGEIKQASGRAKEHTWSEQKTGEKWEGGEREGGGVGSKGIACSQPNILPLPVCPRMWSNSAI